MDAAMYRWFRYYNDAIHDPKLLRLSDRLHRLWIGLLCIASKHDGMLRSVDDMAVMLRTQPSVLEAAIKRLIAARLIDDDGGTLKPHNWEKWQPKSDGTDPTASARMRRYRERQRNDRNANVTLIRPDQTRPDIDTDKDANPVADATDAAKRRLTPPLPNANCFQGDGKFSAGARAA